MVDYANEFDCPTLTLHLLRLLVFMYINAAMQACLKGMGVGLLAAAAAGLHRVHCSCIHVSAASVPLFLVLSSRFLHNSSDGYPLEPKGRSKR